MIGGGIGKIYHRYAVCDNVQCICFKYNAVHSMDGVTKCLRLKLRVEDYLDEKKVLMLKYD